MPKVTAAQTQAAHARRKSKGWIRFHYWMSPEAQRILRDRQLPGETRTQTIERLLRTVP